MRYLVTFLRICGLVLIAFIGCLGGGDEGCEFDKCEGVVCPPDDNECTREGCNPNTGSCTSWPVENGTSCTYNGLSGVCVNGVCGENLCEDVVCDDDDACTEGTCDYVDGRCDFTPIVCDDYETCTENNCNPADGCDFTTPVEDGTRCGSEMWMCIAGECVWGECWTPDDCDDGNDCTEDACSVGVCENPQVEDGTSCAGGACVAGACELTGSVLPCTEEGIRNAIAAGGGPYTFDCGGPQTVMTGATIGINNSVILYGEGNLTIDANEAHRVFSVWPSDVTAELRGVTITGGLTNDGGGGILNFGTLTLTNSTVSGNTAEFQSYGNHGGGIRNEGELTLINSTVSGNTGWFGGGVLNDGTLTLMNSTVSGNTAEHSGGGIDNQSGTLTLTNSTVSGNTAEQSGGGVNVFIDGTLTLTNSTVSGNASDFGGGIESWGVVTLTNSTVSGNASELGGGIWSWGGVLMLTSSLVDGVCEGAITSGGYNIESPGDTCGFDQGTDLVNVPDPMLGWLQDNGGPTETHALLPGTPAINRIPGAACEVDTDQRGRPRPEPGGTMCDVGAFEVQP